MALKRRKLFLGFSLSPALSKSLGRLMRAWPTEPLILTREENLHVTLYFLGFVTEEEITEITEKIREKLENQEGFEVTFTHITFVPESGAPKMIYLSGEPSEKLLALQESLEKIFSPYLTAKKSYRPHSTLARVRRSRLGDLKDRLALPKTVHYVEPVETVTLFESTVVDGKRQYVALDSFPLK